MPRSVNTLIARGMFCGARYTHHTFTPIVKHLITTTANKHPSKRSFIDKNMRKSHWHQWIYYAEFATVEPVTLFLSLLLMVWTICVRLFLIQTSCSRSHLHTEQSRAQKISTFLKSFAVFIFLLQKSGWSELREGQK